MPTKKILHIGKTENLKNVDYLLELAGCRVTQVGDMVEAVHIMMLKSSALRKLDLILIDDFTLLVRFIETFNGTVTLREKYPVIVFDKLNLRKNFRQMFDPALVDFDVRLCSGETYVDEIERVLGINLRGTAAGTRGIAVPTAEGSSL